MVCRVDRCSGDLRNSNDEQHGNSNSVRNRRSRLNHVTAAQRDTSTNQEPFLTSPTRSPSRILFITTSSAKPVFWHILRQGSYLVLRARVRFDLGQSTWAT